MHIHYTFGGCLVTVCTDRGFSWFAWIFQANALIVPWLNHKYLLPNLYLLTIHEHLISFNAIIYIVETASVRKLRISLSRDYILQFLCALEAPIFVPKFMFSVLTTGVKRKDTYSNAESLGFLFGQIQWRFLYIPSLSYASDNVKTV
jgi:hypothetical protein